MDGRQRGFEFQVTGEAPEGAARCGLLRTPHGQVETPAFMPVGTAATVKALPLEDLRQFGASILLANTYHLYLRPGHEVVRRLGGLHGFMAWDRTVLTDSGGYQVYSHRELRRISDEGVEFRSHLDGSRHFLTPEKSIDIQMALGADILMAFDDCTPYPVSQAEARESMLRSMTWARRCRDRLQPEARAALFGIVQGGVFPELRRESLNRLLPMGFEGLALGGLSVGEPKQLMAEVVEQWGPQLPPDRPRYLMGVGTPLDLVHGVMNGIDLFDCVLPTRNARNGTLFTWEGKVRIKNSRYASDPQPLDASCPCRVCRTYSKAYLRHLFVAGEILSSILNTYHNIFFYLELMREIRRRVVSGGLGELRGRLAQAYDERV